MLSTLLLGALLAPPLFYVGQHAATVPALGFLAESDFRRYFNRAILAGALISFYPLLRWVGWRNLSGLGLRPDPHRWRHLAGGFLISFVTIILLGIVLTNFGIYHWKRPLPWNLLPRVLASALTVGALEEGLFRGLFLGVAKRHARPVTAAVFVSALFAILHFLKPVEDASLPVRWYSGLALIPQIFGQFTEPQLVVAGFTTLFVLGMMLAHATLRTGSLWLSIGLHSGLVFGKMGFNKLAKRVADTMPWFGPDLTIGLGSVLVLLFVWFLSWYFFLRERSFASVVEHAR
ncbi:MAG: CPBP family intramembrane metalloprotease [Verrucomicrobia bacterium]|nr:CPBP family intramembrane metalloprotease [Verrucomicrobiota bacterium]